MIMHFENLIEFQQNLYLSGKTKSRIQRLQFFGYWGDLEVFLLFLFIQKKCSF